MCDAHKNMENIRVRGGAHQRERMERKEKTAAKLLIEMVKFKMKRIKRIISAHKNSTR